MGGPPLALHQGAAGTGYEGGSDAETSVGVRVVGTWESGLGGAAEDGDRRTLEEALATAAQSRVRIWRSDIGSDVKSGSLQRIQRRPTDWRASSCLMASLNPVSLTPQPEPSYLLPLFSGPSAASRWHNPAGTCGSWSSSYPLQGQKKSPAPHVSSKSNTQDCGVEEAYQDLLRVRVAGQPRGSCFRYPMNSEGGEFGQA